ncbi:TniB family NTP-binding protein [Neisseria elongata]|uniref:hypothetical protein n=1 Tax=Neisseria elongata TaxID=495 RepID=UPI001F247DC3|nr:hypothetical protein [Neisseria elongata]
MKIANINNLSLVSVAMERLVNRLDGLPGLGVLYGPSGFGKTTATVAVANETAAAQRVEQKDAVGKNLLRDGFAPRPDGGGLPRPYLRAIGSQPKAADFRRGGLFGYT